jgi:Tfp pilus assembly protein PilP
MRASRRDVAKVSRHETWRILGVLALVMLVPVASSAATPATPASPAPARTGTVTAPAKAAPQAAPAKAPATAQAAPVKPAPATAQVPASTHIHPNPATAKAAPTATRTTRVTTAPNVAVAARPSEVVPARRTAKGAGVQAVPSIEEQVTYQYNALGRRDPFQPMAGGTFVGDDVGGDAPLDVGGIKVVGIVWGASDKFALVEDARGTSSVLRAGDKVMNGVVESLKRDAVVVNLTVDGQTETVSIPLTRKGDQTNANR